MKQIIVKKEMTASADKIWAILRTGTGLNKWLPFVATCQLNGDKRVCTTHDGKTLKETIISVDDQAKIFKYKIDEQDMLPTKNYVGTVSLHSNMGKTEAVWVADFEMTMEEAYPQVEQGLTEMLNFTLQSLDTAALN